MTTSEIWARRRERLAKFKKDGLPLDPDADHCKYHHWHANWCPACVEVKKQLREEQALENARLAKHHIDLRGSFARCARFP